MGCGSSKNGGERIRGPQKNLKIVGRPLGKGASCMVLKVVDDEGIHYAQKKVDIRDSNLGEISEADIRIFWETECRVLKTLNHNNIIKCFDCWETRDHFNILMELCEGGMLIDRISARHNYTEKDASELASIMMNCLHECHKNNIIHRDLKPENFVMRSTAEDADVVLIDFGCAKQGDPLSIVDDMAGTPFYVAPEVLLNEDLEIDRTIEDWKKSDVWSLGIIIYMMLVGRVPFEVDHCRKLHEIFHNIKNKPLTFPPNHNLSDECVDLLTTMLNKDENARPGLDVLINHKWIQDAEDRVIATDALKGMADFVNQCHLKKAVAAMVANDMDPHHEERLKAIFHQFDSSGDGRLGPAEIATMLQSMGCRKAEADRIIEGADADGDGTVNCEEFIAAEAAAELANNKQMINDAFKKIDKDNDGFLSMSEVMEFLHVDEATVKLWISEVDSDNDHNLSFDEWKTAMMKTPVDQLRDAKMRAAEKSS